MRFWQRREVFMTMDMNQFYAARAVLDKAGIAYEEVCRGGHSLLRADTGRSGRANGTSDNAICYLYTGKADADDARALIAMALRGL